uniref:Ig-like domain-containing protein n=1 Tax=Chrysemys picta bellii TaxID=8478 RepID=A0A8C3J0X7_CHRPI
MQSGCQTWQSQNGSILHSLCTGGNDYRRGRAMVNQVPILHGLGGCWAVTGPGAVRGPPGGSVAVRCGYRTGYEDYQKFWCRTGGLFCSNGIHIVDTDGSEAEVTRDRVSIRDNHTQRVFTVTLDNLTRADAGTYHCGVLRTGLPDLRAAVEVTVSPGKSLRFSIVFPLHRFQPSIICFLLLMLLKVLLFLCIVCAVIWMSVRYRRSHREMVPDRQGEIVQHSHYGVTHSMGMFSVFS